MLSLLFPACCRALRHAPVRAPVRAHGCSAVVARCFRVSLMLCCVACPRVCRCLRPLAVVVGVAGCVCSSWISLRGCVRAADGYGAVLSCFFRVVLLWCHLLLWSAVPTCCCWCRVSLWWSLSVALPCCHCSRCLLPLRAERLSRVCVRDSCCWLLRRCRCLWLACVVVVV